jgi:hypothetical protein
MPQTGMLKRRCEYSNLTHYPNCGWNCLRWSTSGKLFNERPMTLTEHDLDRSLTCCVNTVQKVDVAQRVDEPLSLYTKYGCATRGTKRTGKSVIHRIL